MACITVVGGGFGGAYALLELERVLGKEHELLLFEPRARFVFTPLLHEVASGVLDKDTVTINYDDLFSRVRHIRHAVEQVDLKRKVVITKEGPAEKEYPFDYIIIGIGAKTNFFGKEYSERSLLELKSLEDAIAIRATIEQNVRKAATMLEHDPSAEVMSLLSAIVVGAGPTGVEVAGECIDFLKFRMKREDIRSRKPLVTIISAKDAVLPNLDEHYQRVAKQVLERKGVAILGNAKVTNVEENTAHVLQEAASERKNNREGKHDEKMATVTKLNAACIIWTAGILPNMLAPFAAPIAVRDTLQAKDYDFAFAIGDSSRIESGPLAALAQVASKEGEAAADNIARLIAGRKPVAFRFRNRGVLVSLGQKNGVGRIFGMPVRGFPAWFIMRTVYLFKFKNIRQELRTALVYTIRLFHRTRLYVGERIRVHGSKSY